MSSSSISSLQAQPQERTCDCSHRDSTPETNQAKGKDFESWSASCQAVQRQECSSPLKIKTKGRFTIIEEEGSSPKLSFRLPSWGGSLSGQQGAARYSSGHETAAAFQTAFTPGNVKAANIEIHSSLHRPAVSSNSSSTAPRRRSAAGALQMPGQTQ